MASRIEGIGAKTFIDQLAALACELGVKIYLTGGGLRDALLGRTIKDLDFALTALPEQLPALFARHIGGTFFWLDTENMQSRVAKRTGEGHLTFDFAPLRGVDIETDLSLRDFTINAMALELADVKTLIDPLKGEEDLRGKTIRRCSPATFTDDPLRLLRAVRLTAQLGFAIEKATWHDMQGKAPSLEKVAAERKRDEFLKILAAPKLCNSLTLLHDTRLLAEVIPGNGKIDEAGITRQMAAAVRVENVMQELREGQPDGFQRLATHLDCSVEGEITSLTLVKLAAFMGDAKGAESAAVWGSRLRLGRKATRMLALLGKDTKARFAQINRNPVPRALFRFFRDHEPAGMEIALLALAGGKISRSLWNELANYCFNEYDSAGTDLLLSGKEVMELLGMHEGMAVGEAMEMLREAESRGQAASREEAREFLRKNLLTKEAPML